MCLGVYIYIKYDMGIVIVIVMVDMIGLLVGGNMGFEKFNKVMKLYMGKF